MKKIVLLGLLSLILIILTSCKDPQEEIVSKYFQAILDNDRDTMNTMSADPKTLQFKSYEILNFEGPISGEIELPNLVKKFEDIKNEMKDLALKAGEFKDKVLDLETELDDTRVKSKRTELETQIADIKKQQEEAEQKYKNMFPVRNEIKKQIELEKSFINLSTNKQDSIETEKGKTEGFNVFVKVVLANNEVQDYVFQLRRYIYIMPDNTEWTNRYIIVKIDTKEDFEKSKQKPVQQ